MDIVAWAILTSLIGVVLVYLSRDQPFPEISMKQGVLLLGLGAMLLVSSASPREFDGERVAATIVTIIGGIQMMFVGDIFQIAPIEPRKQSEWDAFRNDYKIVT